MAIDIFQTLNVIEVMENFIQSIRPPENVRIQVDISYKIENQSIVLFEIRPQWRKPVDLMEHPFAKTTFVKSKSIWKVFWMRADLKWYSYPPSPTVKSLLAFTKLVTEDKHHCFFG